MFMGSPMKGGLQKYSNDDDFFTDYYLNEKNKG